MRLKTHSRGRGLAPDPTCGAYTVLPDPYLVGRGLAAPPQESYPRFGPLGLDPSCLLTFDYLPPPINIIIIIIITDIIIISSITNIIVQFIVVITDCLASMSLRCLLRYLFFNSVSNQTHN